MGIPWAKPGHASLCSRNMCGQKAAAESIFLGCKIKKTWEGQGTQRRKSDFRESLEKEDPDHRKGDKLPSRGLKS